MLRSNAAKQCCEAMMRSNDVVRLLFLPPSLIVPSLRRSGFHDDHDDHADHADDCVLNDYFLDDVLPHSLSFLKKGPTTDLRLGAAASAVGTFSGCSTHNL